MLFQVLKYDVFGDRTVGGGEIPASPEPTSPIVPAQRGKFPLHSVRRTALHPAHQIGNRELLRHRHEHVDVVAVQDPAQDVDLVLAANLAADVTHPQAHLTGQHLEPVLCRPDEMVSMVEIAVLSGVILPVLQIDEKDRFRA